MEVMSEEEKKKLLAEMKRRLEEKILNLQSEIDLLRSVISIIDEQLAELSFSSGIEILESKKKEEKVTIEETKKLEGEVIPFVYKNKNYGKVIIKGNEMTIELDPSLNLNPSVRPFENFFINRVLEGMRDADTVNASKGIIRPDQIISYNIIDDGQFIRKIEIKNFRDRQRMRDILNGLGWTIENMLKNISARKTGQ